MRNSHIRYREANAIIEMLMEEAAKEGGNLSAFMRRITREALRRRGRDVPAVLVTQGRKRREPE